MKNGKLFEPQLCGWSSITEKMIENKDEVMENYKNFSEAGFNMTGLRPFKDKEKFNWVMDALEKYNISFVFQSPRVIVPEDESEIYNDVKDNCLFPNCMGVFIVDEPSIKDFPVVKKLRELYEKYLPEGKLVFSNLFPNYANTQQLGNTQINTPADKKWVPIPSENLNFLIDEYEDYVEKYMMIVSPPALCYDHYMISSNFRTDESSKKLMIFRFMMNLSAIAKAGKKYDVPYWNIIQALSFCKNMITPNFVEYRWMANMSYALGISTLVTFIYRNYYEEGGGVEEWYDAPVKFNGEKTFAYDVVKSANTELKRYIGKLVEFQHKGVYSHKLPDFIESSLEGLLLEDYPDQVLHFSGDDQMILGYFENENNEGLLVMNTSFSETGSMYLQLNSDTECEIWNKTGIEKNIGKDFLNIQLEPGEASFICFNITNNKNKIF